VKQNDCLPPVAFSAAAERLARTIATLFLLFIFVDILLLLHLISSKIIQSF